MTWKNSHSLIKKITARSCVLKFSLAQSRAPSLSLPGLLHSCICMVIRYCMVDFRKAKMKYQLPLFSNPAKHTSACLRRFVIIRIIQLHAFTCSESARSSIKAEETQHRLLCVTHRRQLRLANSSYNVTRLALRMYTANDAENRAVRKLSPRAYEAL
jgi:hypothetical protein